MVFDRQTHFLTVIRPMLKSLPHSRRKFTMLALKNIRQIAACLLAALSFSAMAADTFMLNGRSVQLEPARQGAQQSKSASVDKAQARVVVRDLVSGQTSVYADGLIITLKNAADLRALLQNNPALSLQYAPGVYAYVRVPRGALAAAVNALNADPRVAAVHLRPVPLQIKPR